MEFSRTTHGCSFAYKLEQGVQFATALYTTIYPGCEPFLREWIDSVERQTNTAFDIWIGVDGLPVSSVAEQLDTRLNVNWIIFEHGATPAQIRDTCFTLIANKYQYVIFVDSDDLLLPQRVEVAIEKLQEYTIYGCALSLIDVNGRMLDRAFQYKRPLNLAEVLPVGNIFGLSNTAYQCNTLAELLPIPNSCVLVDWYLATVAWLKEYSFYFDQSELMLYRQYEQNTARVLPPFTTPQLIKAAQLMLQHYELVFQRCDGVMGKKLDLLRRASIQVEAFYKAISQNNMIADRYIEALNKSDKEHIWWDFVAAPELEDLWKQ